MPGSPSWRTPDTTNGGRATCPRPEARPRAQLAVGLYSDEDSLGGLNLYATETDQIDAVAVAQLFAAQAAIALGRLQHEVQLNEALQSRKAIGQAFGLVMERYQLDEDRALQFLIRASNTAT